MHNNPLRSFWTRLKLFQFRRANALFVKPPKLDLDDNDRKKFFFDFSDDKYTHLGDILFYLPLILFLTKKKEFYIAILTNIERASFINSLLRPVGSVVDLYVIKSALDYPSEGVIITSPYKLFDYKSSKLIIVGLGNPHEVIDLKYPIYLANIFLSNFLDFNDKTESVNDGFEVWRNNFCSSLGNARGSFNSNLLWVSPFIASGKFRDFLDKKKNAIINFAKQKADADNLDFALIGSVFDRRFFSELDINHDLRGRDLVELMFLANSDSVKAGVGFDNFWMHFFDIIGKPYFVKFRGRFLKSQYDLHFKSINLSFLRSSSRIYF
jgi:hypothetical protein